jgi:diguanylate cyclase (GGDEF)-like protein/hemerythrin-like metal-binding protein/PAS domain S-box-containing protein
MYSVQIFPWNKNLETGMPVIDEQHGQLVELINRLAGHFAYQSETLQFDAIFDELTDYARYHFQTEEAIWRTYLPGDALLTEHQGVHAHFIDAVQALKAEEASQPRETVIENILKFLTHWLVKHILAEDMHLAKVVQAQQAGMSVAHARAEADQAMSGTTGALIDSILTMYDTLTVRSLQLTREISNRKKAETKLLLASTVIENTLDAICITDAEANIIEVNPAFCHTMQSTAVDFLGQNIRLVKSGFGDASLSATIWQDVREHGHWSGELTSCRKKQELVTEWLALSAVKNEQGVVSNYVAVFSDISQLVIKRRNIDHVANHDSLTGLPNRRLLSERLRMAISHATRQGSTLAVCFLDLDGFKQVNDQFGHASGDEVLREVAQRLLGVVRSDDTVLRLGGDEFVLLLGNLKCQTDHQELCDRLLQAVAQPIVFENQPVHLSASIGITLFPHDDSDPEALIEHADQAMYHAKLAGKATYFLYTSELLN